MASIAAWPLIVIGLVVLLLLCAAVEGGNRLGGWLRRRSARGAITSPDHLVTAVLGLLALLLGFTFSLALNRHENRRELVIQEANAIGTTYLRAQILSEPYRARMSTLLAAYLDERIGWSTSGELRPSARSSALQQQLWLVTGDAVNAAPPAQLSRALMDTMNDSFDRASDRIAARQAHLPYEVLLVLVLYMVLSATMLGYMAAATGRRHRMATFQLFVLLVLALLLILDLDRPRGGGIQISQQPLFDVRATMR